MSSTRPGPRSREGGRGLRLPALVFAAAFVSSGCGWRTAPEPLKPNPVTTEALARAQVEAQLIRAARTMPPAEVSALEEKLRAEPGDLAALKRLLLHYAPDVNGGQPAEQTTALEARRRLVLALIANHPEDDLAGSWAARIFTGPPDPLPDPEGYAQARAAWLSRAADPTASARLLGHAASFLDVADKAEAEQLLLRARALEPDGPWTQRLGRLYAMALLGSTASTPMNVVRAHSAEEADSPFARSVRAKLEASPDADLLATTGLALLSAGPRDWTFDPDALGRAWIDRAVQLAPDSTIARAAHVSVALVDRSLAMREQLKDTSPGAQLERVLALPPAERFPLLGELSERAFAAGENIRYTKAEWKAAQASWERARRYASEAVTLAPQFTGHPDYALVLFKAHQTLAILAVRNGDMAGAASHLAESSRVPASEDLTYMSGVTATRAVHQMIRYGDRAAVIEYFDRMAAVNRKERDSLVQSAESLRRGEMPDWYQRTLGQ